jgi:hypothetical protein
MLAALRPLECPSGQACGAGLPDGLNLPASLCTGLRFTPEQFAALCQANPEAVLELAAGPERGAAKRKARSKNRLKSC